MNDELKNKETGNKIEIKKLTIIWNDSVEMEFIPEKPATVEDMLAWIEKARE